MDLTPFFFTVLVVNLVLGNISTIALRGFALRRWMFVLVVCALWLPGGSRVMAGCHYGDGRSFHSAKLSDNPREHARNFTFLGQWVYERGEMKYVPWQGEAPCHGPNCRTDNPRPVSTSSPANLVQRVPVVVLPPEKSSSFASETRVEWLAHEDCEPLAGFLLEHLRPPRLSVR